MERTTRSTLSDCIGVGPTAVLDIPLRYPHVPSYYTNKTRSHHLEYALHHR